MDNRYYVILKKTEHLTYNDLAIIFNENEGRDLTGTQLRNRLQRETRKYSKEHSIPKMADIPHSNKPYNKNDAEIVLDMLRHKAPKERMLEVYTERVLAAHIADLVDKGFNIKNLELVPYVVNADNEYEEHWDGTKTIRFGLIGDTQINSIYTQLTHLHNFYDISQAKGIKTIYHTGDIDEGEMMRKGHQYECYHQGADAHVREIVRVYPRRQGITTKFITGNHDHSIIKAAGMDIGFPIAKARDDMVYLGPSSAVVKLTPRCTLELRHPLDGSSYAISYKSQKMVDAMSGGEKPSVLAIGHYHKAEYIFYRNIHTFQTGCFQAQTSWMKGKSLAAHLGGWIVEVDVDEHGSIKAIRQEFIPYYTAIKDDYLNWATFGGY